MKFRKAVSIALILSLVAGIFAGCGNQQQAVEESSEEKTRIVIDQLGNEVELPEKIDRVVIASVWPLASVYVLAMGTDKLVGLDPAIISAAENSALIKIAPEIGEIESSFSQDGFMNVEELIKLDPDVVLYSSGVPEDLEIATQAGIPAVAFDLGVKDWNAVETINSWIELLGEVMNEDLGSVEYVEYGNDLIMYKSITLAKTTIHFQA